MQMSAVVPVKCCIGIETEVLRHNIAVQFNRTLMLSMPDINLPVMFIHADINTFTSLNSITKLYMYDAVYTPSLLEKIKCIFNHTSSIQFIATTQNLKKLGFDVDLHCELGSLVGRGGNMSHQFYIYKSNHYVYNDLSSIVDSRLSNAILVGTNQEMRYAEVDKYMYSVHNT